MLSRDVPANTLVIYKQCGVLAIKRMDIHSNKRVPWVATSPL